jgi:hypothetical protein
VDNPSLRETALKEWSDFKAIVCKNQAVAFRRFTYVGALADEYVLIRRILPTSMAPGENPIRGESVTPTSPNPYPLNMGLTKLSSTGDLAPIVNPLQRALNP